MKLVVVLLVATSSLFGLVVASSTPNPPRPPCTIIGTDKDNVLAGSEGADVICALQGNDYVAGNGGPDQLLGDNGWDTLIGGRGRDVLKGLNGDDRLFAVDGNSHDVLKGGRGSDRCYGDRDDKFQSCEGTPKGLSLELVNQLSQSFYGALVLAEELIPPTIAPPPGVTQTITITITITRPPLPECTPPPISPPPPC